MPTYLLLTNNLKFFRINENKMIDKAFNFVRAM